ncbi:MAG: FlgO family outer membrane protein [marine benthic group bacterium]|jgi:TolB-like protein|nr:FlgO family outer membrane protein [Gemmatimonadota bacterium]
MTSTPTPTPGYQRFFAELKRRRVFRVMAVYGATAFVVLQVADIAFPALGLPEWAMTLVLALTLVGFPIAVVVAWAFEVSPEGMKRTEDADAAELQAIISAPPNRRWPAGLLALAGVAALVWGAWLVGKRAGESGAEAAVGESGIVARTADVSGDDAVLQLAYADLAEDRRPSIAVLPFVNMSSDKEQEYFADGMTEELLNALARIRELRVAGRTSSFAYKGQDRDLRQIGEELGVRYLVEGSVRKQGDQLRITAQLVDAEDAFHVWSDAYDRTLDDVFAVQEEIAGAIAQELQVSLGLDETASLVAPTGDMEAYEMYLEGRARMRQRGEGVFEAVRLFEAVVARDSMWAPGWAGLAQAYALTPFYYPGAVTEELGADVWGPALEATEAAAVRALELDPSVAGAEIALGNVFRDRWEWEEAEVHYLRALDIDPDNAEAHQQYAEMLAATGRGDEALRSARRAVALDPTSAIRLNVLSYILLQNDRAEESLAQAELAIVHGGEIPQPYRNLTRAHLVLGDLDEAESAFRDGFIPRLGFDSETAAMRDRWAEARFDALRTGNVEAYERCCLSAGFPGDLVILGDTAGAIEMLRAWHLSRPRFNALTFNQLWRPELDAIRDDPRFQSALEEILAHAGLEGAQLRRAQVGE